MLLVAHIIKSLLLPPGFALAGLALALLLLGAGQHRIAAVLVAATMLVSYTLSIRLVGDWLLRPLELRHPGVSPRPGDCDVIVVLGSGARSDPGSFWPEELLDSESLRRTLMALRLWRSLALPLLLLGGRPFADQPESESLHRAMLLGDLGIPTDQLLRLDTGRTTFEEAQVVARLAANQSWRRPCMVTSAWHLPRAVAAFEHAGLAVVPVPCSFVAQDGPMTVRDLLPSATGLAQSALALHEYLGLAHYRLRHGIRLMAPR